MLGWDSIGERWVDLTATLRDGAPVTGPGEPEPDPPTEELDVYTRMIVAPGDEDDLTGNDYLAVFTAKDSPADPDETHHPIQDPYWIPETVA